MRVTKEKARENRERVVATAAMLFREHGFDGVGVAKLMEQAGLTHGGFYNHFRSKEDLITEASAKGFGEIAERYAGVDAKAAIELYLSKEHRDGRGRGCPAAALGSDAARQSNDTRAAFAIGIEKMITAFESGAPLTTKGGPDAGDRDVRARAISLLAQAVGAVILSRACPPGEPLADEILDSCRTDCLFAVESASRDR